MNASTNIAGAFSPDVEHDVAQRGGQAVGRGHGGEADDDVADEAERAGLQALVRDPPVAGALGGSAIAMCRNIRFLAVPGGLLQITEHPVLAVGGQLRTLEANTSPSFRDCQELPCRGVVLPGSSNYGFEAGRPH